MWIYLLIIYIVCYCIYKERQSLGCYTIIECKDYDNKNGKAVKGTESSPDDSTEKVLDTIDFATDYQNRFVKWRILLLLSIFASVLIWFLLYKKLIPEWEMIFVTIMLFVIMASAVGYYKFHLDDHVMQNIRNSVNILRKRM